MASCARTRQRLRLLAAVGLTSFSTLTGGLSNAKAADTLRGELLYNTHCVACHNAEVHWRNQRLATDWKSLNVQVRRWQSAIQLNWDDADIASTASYLNSLYYLFPEKQERLLGQRR